MPVVTTDQAGNRVNDRVAERWQNAAGRFFKLIGCEVLLEAPDLFRRDVEVFLPSV